MKGKIGNRLLASIKSEQRPYQIHDTELRGFILRVQPTGAMTYLVLARMKNGKRVRVTLGQHPRFTPMQARDAAKEKLSDIMKGIDPSQRSRAEAFTLKRFVEEKFESWAQVNLKSGPETKKRILYAFKEFESYPLSKINAWTIEKWRTYRLKDGISKATVNRDITALKCVFALAVRQRTLLENPLKAVKAKRIDSRGVVRYLSASEETRLREQLDQREEKVRAERISANQWRGERGYPILPDLRDLDFVDHLKPLVLITLNTGLRRGELLQLRWEAIDFSHRVLTVIGSTAKSGETRHLPLNEEAFATVQAWHRQSNRPSEGWVFSGEGGNHLTDIKKPWTALLCGAQIYNFRWHDLRHHFASRLVMAGVDLNTVRELLGHSDMKMAIRYAHLGPHIKAEAVAKLVRL